MWVRSQDKWTLIKVNQFVVQKVCDGDETAIKAFEGNECTIYLGEYNTEKRALEVLDEIQHAICYYKATEIMGLKMDGLSEDIINGFVYQMPEK